MKKFLTSAGLVALGVSGLQAAYAPDLTPMEASKPWSVSTALRGFYDDNVNTSPSNQKESSYGYEVNPSLSLNLPLDQTFVSLSYEYSMRYYEDRPSGKYDQDHTFDGLMEHAFSERYKIKVEDSFVVAQEPDVLGGGSTLRTDGDNVRNLGSIQLTAQMTELLAIQLSYANTLYVYSQDGGTASNPSRAGLLNRLEHRPTVDLKWQVREDTDALVGYSFGLVNFTADEPIGTTTSGETVKSDDRNAQSHRIFVGADHRFSPQLNGSIRVGGEYTDFYNASDSSLSPYVDSNLAYEYNRGCFAQVGTRYQHNQTDVNSLDQETTLIYGSITHKITAKLVGSLLLQLQHSKFQGGSHVINSNEGKTETFFISGLNLAYNFNPHFAAEAGYNFDNLDSQVPGRTYSRNRVYVGVKATF